MHSCLCCRGIVDSAVRSSHHLKICSTWEDGATLDDMLCDEVEEHAAGRRARNARRHRDGETIVRRIKFCYSLRKRMRQFVPRECAPTVGEMRS